MTLFRYQIWYPCYARAISVMSSVLSQRSAECCGWMGFTEKNVLILTYPPLLNNKHIFIWFIRPTGVNGETSPCGVNATLCLFRLRLCCLWFVDFWMYFSFMWFVRMWGVFEIVISVYGWITVFLGVWGSSEVSNDPDRCRRYLKNVSAKLSTTFGEINQCMCILREISIEKFLIWLHSEIEFNKKGWYLSVVQY